MKKLTEEEARQIGMLPNNKKMTPARAHMINMKPGEIILLERHEWKWRDHTPATMCGILAKKKGMKFTCHLAMNKSGWIIKRVG